MGAASRECYGLLFPEARFKVWNRTTARAHELADAWPNTEATADLEGSVRGADIVTSATMSVDPILKGAWLRPGTHVDLIGAYRPDMREVDDDALLRGRLFVDSRATTLEHIGELRDPIARGVITPDAVVADYYELDRFTRSLDDITIFKNGGGAHLDLMKARYILDTWQAQ